MYERISTMLQRYERGEIRRRDLICGLAVLAGLAKPAPAAEASTFKGVEVNHIALNVTNVQRSRDFYQKHLGAPIRSESAQSCFLGLGNDFLALFQGTNPGMNHFCIGIENYEVGRVTAELKRQGFSPRQPAGSGRVYFDDPDGIEVQLAAAGHQP